MVSVILAVVFLWHIRRAPNPVMEYRLVARRLFVLANLYNFLFGAVTMGFYSFIPYYAVVKFGLSPFESAAVLTPRAPIVTTTSLLASLYVKRLGFRWPMLLGMACVGLTFVTDGPGLVERADWWLVDARVLAAGGADRRLAGSAWASPTRRLRTTWRSISRRTKRQSITGVRGMFRLAGGTISISCVVLALSMFQDQASGLDLIFLVFSGVLLLTVPLVLLIPEPRRAAVVRVEQALPARVPARERAYSLTARRR